MATTPTAATGANVRAEMARKKISQAALADHMGLSQAAISARLNGRTPFDINELAAIAHFLDVGLEALIPTVEAEAGVA